MPEINLLPWRSLKREQEKKHWVLYWALAFIASSLVVFLMNTYATQLLRDVIYEQTLLKNEILILDKQLKGISQAKTHRSQLIKQIHFLESLLIRQVLSVHLFDVLSKTLPGGIFFTKVECVEDKVTLIGWADSNRSISKFLGKIRTNPWVLDPNLKEVVRRSDSQKDQGRGMGFENKFTLSFVLIPDLDNRYHD